MIATKFTTKNTTNPSFLETQFLKLKASKNKAFVLTMIATLVVFVKWISAICYSSTQQRTLKSMLASMSARSDLMNQLQNGRQFRIESPQNDRRGSWDIWQKRGQITWIISSKWLG